MNIMKKAAVTAALTLTTTGVLAAGTVAANADVKDTRSDTGSCSRQGTYTYQINDYGPANGKVRVRFDIDTNKGSGREWTAKVYRNGHLKRTLHESTGGAGKAFFDTVLFADDDSEIKVVATSGYGDRCQDTLRLDT